MDIAELDAPVESYLRSCIAPTTRAAYRLAQYRYEAFCSSGVSPPYPLREDTLCSYVAFVAKEGLKHRTIKAYLSGMRFLQIQLSLGNPFANGGMPRLEYELAGIKQAESQSASRPRTRLPITISIMHQLKARWITTAPKPDNIMLWAAACTGFWGFLRTGEFTVPSACEYDPSVHLNLSDVAIDNHQSPSVVQLHIKQSKTDPFCQGVEVFLGKSESAVCPVLATVWYIGVRKLEPGPLFILESSAPLTRSFLVAELQAALKAPGMDESLNNAHSFRIGAATTAAQQGVEDSLIQTLGRWQSDAYKTYIKLPCAQLATVSRTLARGH